MKKVGKVFLWLIAIFLVIEIVGVVLAYFSKRIPDNTVLAMRLEGLIGEEPPQDALTELVLGPRTTVTDIIEALDRARTDPRITGIAVRVGGPLMGLAKMQEIRQKIREFNRAGKFSVAYLEFGTNRCYFLASACQTVILMPKSVLYIRGLMTSTTFFRGTLDKFGVQPDLYHIGDYKNAMNVYTEKKYTSAHREANQTLLEDFQGQFVRGLGEARGLTPEEATSRDRAEIENINKGGPIAMADFTILNESSLANLEQQAKRIVSELR